MKKFVIIIMIIGITLIISGGIFTYGNLHKDEIYIYYRDNILKTPENIKLDKNEYYRDNNYEFVQNTDDFIAKDRKQLLNIFYTVINSGTDKFSFYCDSKYDDCISDITKLVKDEESLSYINNFVHPFNSFDTIDASYDDYGQVDLIINKAYSNEEILEVSKEVDRIINTKIKDDMSSKKKIEVIHDYIINNGKYATDKIRKQYPNKSYNKANDILINKVGLCSAYSDAMALFLERFGLNNYKIASESHIWNLVYVDNEWLNIDLTWDDPVTSTGVQKLEDIFLLIDYDELKELDVTGHDFNKKIYKEALND